MATKITAEALRTAKQRLQQQKAKRTDDDITPLPVRAPLGYHASIERDKKGKMTGAVLEPFIIDEPVPRKSEL